jgi:hypothetical protein
MEICKGEREKVKPLKVRKAEREKKTENTELHLIRQQETKMFQNEREKGCCIV